MDLLSDLTPQQVLSDPESLESYELDAPSASISAVKADQSTVSVTFGKATTDGTSRYATMNGDSSTVYIFADTLYQALQTPIYDMMTLPELPVLTEETITSISIQGPGEDAEPLLLAAQHTDSCHDLAQRGRGCDRQRDRPGPAGRSGAAGDCPVCGLPSFGRSCLHLRV